MSASTSFIDLQNKAREGDAKGVTEVIEHRFASRLVALAAARISKRLGRRADAEDVIQSVFKTFFIGLDNGQIELRDWESLWGLLVRIAVCRICRHAERNATQGRDQGREIPLTPDVPTFGGEPSAEEVLIAEDLADRLVALIAERHRPIVLKILEGLTHEEIVRALGTSLSTVGRVHGQAREILKEMLAED